MKDKVEFKKELVVQPLSKKTAEFFTATLGRDYFRGRELFSCECGGEGVVIDDDIDKVDYKDKEIYVHSIHLALWQFGQSGSGKLSFKEKLRWCWNIFKTGLPWTDSVILNVDSAERLAQNILKRIEIVKNQEKQNNENNNSKS